LAWKARRDKLWSIRLWPPFSRFFTDDSLHFRIRFMFMDSWLGHLDSVFLDLAYSVKSVHFPTGCTEMKRRHGWETNLLISFCPELLQSILLCVFCLLWKSGIIGFFLSCILWLPFVV
jgi:hypothetical protein